jgi:hypothetical protein
MKELIISDPALVAKLSIATDPVELRDEQGNFLGTFNPPPGKPPPGYVIPIPAEELNRRREIREGKPLSEILKNLGQQ